MRKYALMLLIIGSMFHATAGDDAQDKPIALSFRKMVTEDGRVLLSKEAKLFMDTLLLAEFTGKPNASWGITFAKESIDGKRVYFGQQPRSATKKEPDTCYISYNPNTGPISCLKTAGCTGKCMSFVNDDLAYCDCRSTQKQEMQVHRDIADMYFQEVEPDEDEGGIARSPIEIFIPLEDVEAFFEQRRLGERGKAYLEDLAALNLVGSQLATWRTAYARVTGDLEHIAIGVAYRSKRAPYPCEGELWDGMFQCVPYTCSKGCRVVYINGVYYCECNP